MYKTVMVFFMIIISSMGYYIHKTDKEVDQFIKEQGRILEENSRIIKSQQKQLRNIIREIELISVYIMYESMDLDYLDCEKIAYEVYIQSKENNIPYSLLLGIMSIESNFDPYAVSTRDAKGLMQIYDKRCRDIHIDHNKLYDISYNIDCGIKIFQDKMRITDGDLNKALLKYSGNAQEYDRKVLSEVGKFHLFKSSCYINNN